MNKFAYDMGRIAAMQKIAEANGIDKEAFFGSLFGGGQQGGGGFWNRLKGMAKYMIPGYGMYQAGKSLYNRFAGGGQGAQPGATGAGGATAAMAQPGPSATMPQTTPAAAGQANMANPQNIRNTMAQRAQPQAQAATAMR